MKNLKLNEWFYSLQGEGRRAGQPSIFIRLAGCDLACGFCDTEFESGKEMSVEEIAKLIEPHPCRWIVWTGGEPSLQLTADHISYFAGLGYKQAIETNGNNPAPAGVDWVCVSPKVAEHVVARNYPNGVNELRYVRHKNQVAVPEPKVDAEFFYLSPMFDGDQINIKNLNHCINLCLDSPKWHLSLQTHKLTKIL